MPAQGALIHAWGEPVDGLRLGVGFQGAVAEFCLHNAGAAPVTVLSHVEVGAARHLDWFSLRYRTTGGVRRTLVFTGDRDRSAVVRELLEPGARVVHRVDLAAWARTPVNGGVAFEAEGEAVLVYEVHEDGGAWQGHLEVTASVSR